MINLTINFVDSTNTPLSTTLFVNSISEGTNTSFVLSLAEGDYLFEADSVGKVSWNQTISLQDNETNSKTIVITLNEENTIIEDCSFDYFNYGCVNPIFFFPTFTGTIFETTFDFGDNIIETSSGGGTSHAYKYPYTYTVTMTSVVTPEGDTITCSNEITIPKTIPSVKFLMLCNGLPEYSNNEGSIKKCIESCTDCTCEDEDLCRCVHPNTEIQILIYPELNLDRCDLKEATLILTSNDIEIFNETITTNDTVQIGLTFTEEGVYNLKAILTNCCGNCTYVDSITAGPFISIEKQDCGVYRYFDYSNPKASTTVKIEIYNSDESLTESYLIQDWSTNYFDITVPDDGVYLIKVNYQDSSGTTLYRKSFVLFEFCDIVECYKELVMKKLCVDCECEDKREARKLADKINHFLLTTGAFFMSMKVKYGETFGMFNYNPNQLKTLKNTNKLIKDIKNICGSCNIQSKSGIRTLNVECVSCGSN